MPSILPTRRPKPPLSPRTLSNLSTPFVRCTLWAWLASMALAASAEEPGPAIAPLPPTLWEGAIGLNLRHQPEFAGSGRWVLKASPGVFLRYGRFTVTNTSGFATRRDGDVARGLAVEVIDRGPLRAGLALRYDGGRDEDTSPALRGLGDISPTVRGRLNLAWRMEGPWRLGGSWNWDLRGKGGGHLGDITTAYEQHGPQGAVWSLSATLAVAGDRYLQTYYGITPEQSTRSGYPVYAPRSGLRDATLQAQWRQPLGPDWLVLAGVSATRLLGPAARSPLTTERMGWALSSGVAWRF